MKSTIENQVRYAVPAALLALLIAYPVNAQNTGGLPQQAVRGMEQAMERLENRDSVGTQESLAESFGQEKMDAFLAGAVVKLVLTPEGFFELWWQEGGEIVSVDLGKSTLPLSGQSSEEEEWLKRTGPYKAPKRPQSVSFGLKAGGRNMNVDCYNKFSRSDQSVTYYIGPLDGLFCMGITAEEES